MMARPVMIRPTHHSDGADDNEAQTKEAATVHRTIDRIRQLLNPQPFNNFILLLIIINAIMMGVATFPFVKNNNDIQHIFELVDHILLIIFTIECSMQLIHHGPRNFCNDGFRIFDLLIVILSWAMEGTQVIRAFRIFRASRLIARSTTMRNLVLAIFSVIPKMNAIFLLLLLFFGIFGVLFTELYMGMYLPEGYLSQPYFDNLWYSMFTLFQMMTLNSWASILYQVQRVHPLAWIPFITFVILTAFVVVNLIIAVICDAVHLLGDDSGALGGIGSGLLSYEEEAWEACQKQAEPGHGTQQCNDEGVESGLAAATTSPRQQLSPQQSTIAAATRTRTRTQQRIKEIERQLDEMVMAQDQMRRTIEMLSSRVKMMKMKTLQRRKKDTQ